MTVPECEAHVARAKRLFRLLPDLPALLAEWEALVGTYQCHARVSFDARLATAMRTHGISRLLALNGADFARFPGITVLDPRAVAAPRRPRRRKRRCDGRSGEPGSRAPQPAGGHAGPDRNPRQQAGGPVCRLPTLSAKMAPECGEGSGGTSTRNDPFR
jgi:hypothetical protein